MFSFSFQVDEGGVYTVAALWRILLFIIIIIIITPNFSYSVYALSEVTTTADSSDAFEEFHQFGHNLRQGV